jgi:glutamate-ammonia-ligase adenylyltransferase
VVGYGKLGGIELGHGSDLDLVFIHDAPVGMATTGERAVDNGTFFTRLGQRMIHILTAHTSMGTLYEVDMRLRPSGNSGLLVSSLEAFRQYQEKDAWTWEHQALVRARVVAGDGELAQKFEALRHELLAKPRDEAALKNDVVEMRAKMRSAMLPAPAKADESTLFPVKQGVGGIVDIEFMVQYAVLAWSQNHPALTTFTDNIRILETLQAEGLFSEPEALALMEAYKAYRASAHRLSLQEQKVEVPLADVASHREVVQQKWQALLG